MKKSKGKPRMMRGGGKTSKGKTRMMRGGGKTKKAYSRGGKTRLKKGKSVKLKKRGGKR
tara:strand:- start:305 stop:481 length:177 start_codon:yes stop_codon:yes gene_type:complete